MNNPKLLIIGGAGIVGSQIAEKGLKEGFDVYIITLEEAALAPEVLQIIVDRNSANYVDKVQQLNKQVGTWSIVVDAFAFDESSAKSTYSLFKNNAKHIITISTTLIYDRSKEGTQPITEKNALAKENTLGGYVDGKLSLEKFWASIIDTPWTIVRPYHILGDGSLLGCLPEHNRDPQLVEMIRNGQELWLCESGEVEFNYIHPTDIASGIFAIAGNSQTYGEAYNLVNPTVITAKEYYAEITQQVGGTLNIKNIHIHQIWTELKGWELTTLPHIYSAEKLTDHTGFTATIPLKEGIRDAIINQPEINIPKEKIPIHQRMNKLPRPKLPTWLFNYYEKRRTQ